MNHWPTSRVLDSGCLRPEQITELMTLGTTYGFMSESTLAACCNLAHKLPSCTSMALVCSENAAVRRVFLKHPTDYDWRTLERGGFVTAFNNFGFIMDALH